MRYALWPACLIAVMLAGCGSTTRHSPIALRLGPGIASPESDEAELPLAQRNWTIVAPLRASEPGCRWFSFSTWSQPTFDGRSDGASPTKEWGSLAPKGAPGRIEAQGLPGDAVTVHVSVRCSEGRARGSVARRARTYIVPAISCEGGPIRVLALEGPATFEDDSASGAPHPLHVGDLLRTDGGTSVKLARGTVTVGAPECNGFEVMLSPGTTQIGGYNAYGQGTAFAGPAITLTGDRHAGGVWADGTGIVRPSTVRATSTEEVLVHRSRSAARADAGVIVVHGLEPPLQLEANQETHLSCTARGCFATPPSLVQPGDPLRVNRLPPPQPLASILRDSSPPRRLLAPAFASSHVQSIPASAHEPAELVVDWHREHRTGPGFRAPVQTQQGTIIWVRRKNVWRRLFDYRPGLEPLNLESVTTVLGDVSGDGHPDAIVTATSGGSAGCRDFHVVAEVKGRLRDVFTRRELCEAGDVRAHRGDLVYGFIVGPCPLKGDGAHCYGGVESDTLRWTGHGYERVGVRVRCLEPRLDPKRGCRRKR